MEACGGVPIRFPSEGSTSVKEEAVRGSKDDVAAAVGAFLGEGKGSDSATILFRFWKLSNFCRR